MSARAEAASRTADSVVRAAMELWRENPIEEVTLAMIARRAGVSTRTVIRRFGTREGVFAAVIESEGPKITAERDRAPIGDVQGALDVLLAHYERDGDAVMRTLGVERQVPAARMIARTGRRSHREWCARTFQVNGGARLDALVAATDLYVWKLFRRDLKRSLSETKQAMSLLIEGVLER